MRGFKAIILCAVLAAVLTACSSEPGPSPSGVPAPAEAPVTIAGAGLTDGEARFLVMTAVELYPQEIDWGADYNGMTARRYFLEEALALGVAAHVTSVKAAELGYGLTDSEEGEIDWEIALEADYRGGREAFLEWLADAGLTEEQYRFYSYAVPTLQEKLVVGLFGPGAPYHPDAGTEKAYFVENYRSVSYLFISATDDFGEPLPEDRWTTQRRIAEVLRGQAVDGEDFAELVETHGQDYLMSLSPEGRTITLGELGVEVEAVLGLLEENGISEVIVTGEGFYILKRLPVDWDWYEQNNEDVWYLCAADAFYQKLADWGRDIETVASDTFYALDPRDLMEKG